MRHRKANRKLGRTGAHRQALLSSLVCNFIQQRRIRTTVAKAKEARRLAEKMVTLAKRGTLAARRAAIATLRDKRRVGELFSVIAPVFRDRAGGYTRVVRLGRRRSDGAELALLEWVGLAPVVRERKKKKPAEKAADKAAAEG